MDGGEPSSSRKNCGESWMILMEDHLNIWWKSTVELTTVFNSGSKNISTQTMWRELKGLGLNNSAALRKPPNSDADLKQRLQFVMEEKDWTHDGSRVLMSPDSPCSRLMAASGWGERQMHPSCLVPTIPACVMIWGWFSWSGQLTTWDELQKLQAAARLSHHHNKTVT